MMLNKICQKITTMSLSVPGYTPLNQPFLLEMKMGRIYVSLLLPALDILFDGSCNLAGFFFFLPLSPYINSERKLAVFCSYVLNSSARQHAECSFWNCDGQIKITTCLSRQNDHSMMLPAEINSAVDSRGDSEAVSAAPTVQVLNI